METVLFSSGISSYQVQWTSFFSSVLSHFSPFFACAPCIRLPSTDPACLSSPAICFQGNWSPGQNWFLVCKWKHHRQENQRLKFMPLFLNRLALTYPTFPVNQITRSLGTGPVVVEIWKHLTLRTPWQWAEHPRGTGGGAHIRPTAKVSGPTWLTTTWHTPLKHPLKSLGRRDLTGCVCPTVSHTEWLRDRCSHHLPSFPGSLHHPQTSGLCVGCSTSFWGHPSVRSVRGMEALSNRGDGGVEGKLGI